MSVSSVTPAGVIPAVAKGSAAQQSNVPSVTPATSKAAAIAAESLTKTQKKKLKESKSDTSESSESKPTVETPSASPSLIAALGAPPVLGSTVSVAEIQKDEVKEQLIRENCELKKKVEVLGQQALKGAEQGHKAVQYVERLVDFMKKTLLVENSDKPLVSDFQAVMRQHTETQQQAYKITMERVDTILGEISKLTTTASSLKERVLSIKTQEVVQGAVGHVVEYPKANFEKEVEEFEALLGGTSSKVLFMIETNEVKKHLKKLNKMTVISPDDRIKLRDDFTSKWNQICLVSHTLRLDSIYLRKALVFLPDLNHFIPSLNTLYEEAAKIRRLNRESVERVGNSKNDWEGYNKSFLTKKEEFITKDKEMVEKQKQLHVLLNDLRGKEIPEESHTAFTAHNKPLEAKNRTELTDVYNLHNELNKKLAMLIVTQWRLACEKLAVFAAEIDHIGSEDAVKGVKYNTMVKGGSHANPSVKFDPMLMPK